MQKQAIASELMQVLSCLLNASCSASHKQSQGSAFICVSSRPALVTLQALIARFGKSHWSISMSFGVDVSSIHSVKALLVNLPL